MKLEQLLPYMPYGLQIKVLNHKCDYVGIEYSVANGYYMIGDRLHVTYNGGSTGKDIDTFKPILRPMSGLIPVEEDEINDMVLIKLVNETDQHCDAYDEWRDSYFDNPEPMRLLQAPYEVFEELVKQMYDVFDLIGQGLAISIHDLEK